MELSDETAFLMSDEKRAEHIAEYGSKGILFTNPKNKQTGEHIRGGLGSNTNGLVFTHIFFHG